MGGNRDGEGIGGRMSISSTNDGNGGRSVQKSNKLKGGMIGDEVLFNKSDTSELDD
jgi:hypothetical protein